MTLLLTIAAVAALHASGDNLFEAIRQGNHSLVTRLAGRGADVSAAGPAGLTPLLQAVITSDVKMVRLLIAKGADAKVAGESGITPLHAAVFDAELTRVLLEAGADANAQTSTGATPLSGAVVRRGNDAVIELLLRAGADVNALPASSAGRVSPLRRAIGTGDAGTVRRLIAKGADIKLAEPFNRFAMQGGCVECMRQVLEKGTKPTGQMVADAAAPGSFDLVKLLVEAGAPVNHQDSRGYTPLMRAVLSYNQKPELISYLLAKGAPTAPKNETGDTALSMARRFGETPIVAMLREAGATDVEVVTLPPPVKENNAKAAIARALPLMQKIGQPVFKRRGCVTCHNNTLPAQVVAMARRSRFAVDEEIAKRELLQIVADHRARRQALIIGSGLPEIYGYTLMALNTSGHAADSGTDLAVHQIAFRQEPDGFWRVDDYRPPQEYSRIAATALAIGGLQAYSPPGRAKEMKERIARARKWLTASRPEGAEEHSMRLLGLAWSKTPNATMESAVRDLIALRNRDGGWPQLPGMASDAYATGLALYALRLGGGVAVSHDAYQGGVRYLLDTQRPDGSWFVQTRSYPFQPYFESGFPYGHSQWISAAGSSWALMSLLLTLPGAR